MMFLSAVQATTQLVEQAFRIVARLRKAQERQKGFADVLMRHENELRDIKAIIEVIEDEDDLQTSSVVADLIRLQNIQTKLTKLLATLDPKTKSKLNQVAHQFVQGSSDERKLNVIMDEVVHVKTALLLHIQMANVRFAGNVEKSLVANLVAIQRIDECLRDHLKTCEGLQIAQLLKGRCLSGENVPEEYSRRDLTKCDRGWYRAIDLGRAALAEYQRGQRQQWRRHSGRRRRAPFT